MLYYRKREENGWYIYEERKWLAMLSWTLVAGILLLSIDPVTNFLFIFLSDSQPKISLYTIMLSGLVILLGLANLEPIIIKSKHGIYSRPVHDYRTSKKSGIFTIPYARWFMIKKL